MSDLVDRREPTDRLSDELLFSWMYRSSTHFGHDSSSTFVLEMGEFQRWCIRTQETRVQRNHRHQHQHKHSSLHFSVYTVTYLPPSSQLLLRQANVRMVMTSSLWIKWRIKHLLWHDVIAAAIIITGCDAPTPSTPPLLWPDAIITLRWNLAPHRLSWFANRASLWRRFWLESSITFS